MRDNLVILITERILVLSSSSDKADLSDESVSIVVCFSITVSVSVLNLFSSSVFDACDMTLLLSRPI